MDLAGTALQGAHARTLDQARMRLAQPEQLPSARVLAAIHAEHADCFVDFARARSAQVRQALLSQPLAASQEQALVEMSQASVKEQQRIEALDSLPFEQYRQQYVSPQRLGRPRQSAQADPALSSQGT
jgi:glutamate--cysteine ligase